MSFFNSPDWFGRPGPFAYNLDYIVFIAISIIFAFVLPIALRGAKEKTVKITLIALWALAVLLDTLKYGYGIIVNLSNGVTGIGNYDIPLWTCSMFLYLMPFALFCKNKRVADACAAFVCTISFFAGIVNFAVPCDDSLFSFYGMHKTVYHYVLMLAPAIMLGVGRVKLKPGDIRGIMLVFTVFAIPVYIFNFIFRQDYMFTYDGSWLPIDVSAISAIKPLYILICLAVYALVAMLFIGIDIGVRRIFKKKS
jgi:hypothetical protein